jgi:hypothetical protein
MRTILFTCLGGAFLFFSSCNNNGESKVASASRSEKAQKNLEASHVINEAFRTGDTSKLDEVVSLDFIDHRSEGDMKGIDSLKKSVLWIKETMKDMKMEIQREWADDDYVAAWMRYTGTNPVAMPGFPEGPYDWLIIELTKYKDGKAIEHWGFTEAQTLAKMMAPPDSTNSK